jgi:phytoene synthase
MTEVAGRPSSADLVAMSKAMMGEGSKSFAQATKLFDRETRAGAYLLYAWCRHCDDVIDGQELGHGRETLTPEEQRLRLDGLYAKTRSALAGEPQDDRVFAAFQAVALRYAIPPEPALALIDGFAMDVEGRRYRTFDELLLYCWRVAGVVGVMMARVMGVTDPVTLRRAGDLGLAFQLTNIARDVIDDAANGRVYLPIDWLAEAGVPENAVGDPAHRGAVFAVARRLLQAADPYYASARIGVSRLPVRSAWAIASARGVYRQIGRALLAGGPNAWERRVVVSKPAKLARVAEAGLIAAKARLIEANRPEPPREGLWNPPGRTEIRTPEKRSRRT